MTPRRRWETVESRAKPNSRSCNVGGMINETARRLSRRIWANSLRIRARRRVMVSPPWGRTPVLRPAWTPAPHGGELHLGGGLEPARGLGPALRRAKLARGELRSPAPAKVSARQA